MFKAEADLVGRAPSLSDFETFVMGLLVTVHPPPQPALFWQNDTLFLDMINLLIRQNVQDVLLKFPICFMVFLILKLVHLVRFAEP